MPDNHLKIEATAEWNRLVDDSKRYVNWKRWGPYLSERQWGTVREDYSPHGTCWDYFPHDHARSRAYRWGEDGLLGITDRQCRLCFGLALWNGRDPILKERLYGLTGPEGNHGEDVKEEYFYLESTPTHSWMKALYKYTQSEFPYSDLLEENRRRGRAKDEYELVDASVFEKGRYFDVYASYGKASPNHILIQIDVVNRGDRPAPLDLIPMLWFRNTWSWTCRHEGCTLPPSMSLESDYRVKCQHETLGTFYWEAEESVQGLSPRWLFTDNTTNFERLYGVESPDKYHKDAFHDYVIGGQTDAVNPANRGTRAGRLIRMTLAPGESRSFRFRIYNEEEAYNCAGFRNFEDVMTDRKAEHDDYYRRVNGADLQGDELALSHQAYAGLMWTKQFFHYVVDEWLEGDPGMPEPPRERLTGRNHNWQHFFARDIISMPDKWEYPWFAAWDLAFHCIPIARVDPFFAKRQILLFLKEWYMHPNGQIPAYEFAFDDVNPPVHGWAALRIYQMEKRMGRRDRTFLERVFQKLLLNFTWWVNRKDESGNNLFSGGFLGLDNIGVFDRSQPLPGGGRLTQADGTAWMAFYCSIMLEIALELAWNEGEVRRAYADMATKFLEHFVQIIDSMNHFGGSGLWDEKDGFYYDQIHFENHTQALKTRSLVGLIPLIGVAILDGEKVDRVPGFKKRFDWFLKNKHDLSRHLVQQETSRGTRWLIAIPSKPRLEAILDRLVSEEEFLSPFGIRSLSKYHEKHPFLFEQGDQTHIVRYTPGESNTWMFGGNSNWRGPIWFPVNYLIMESLLVYSDFYQDSLMVRLPGRESRVRLDQLSMEIGRRLLSLFYKNDSGTRPFAGNHPHFRQDDHWQGLIYFHEYFHAETGRGLGASHQTGWTALAVTIQDWIRNQHPHH
jgi:hypothetical protein